MGTFKLTQKSKARKISRYEIELYLHEINRTVILLQIDLSKAPLKTDHFSCLLDDWVESINSVIEYLQRITSTPELAKKLSMHSS